MTFRYAVPARSLALAGAAALALGFVTPGQALAAVSAPTVEKTIQLTAGLYETSVDPLTGEVWVAAAGQGRQPLTSYVYALDSTTGEITKTVDVSGDAAYGLKVNPVTGTVYTTNTRTSSVSVIDAATGTLVKAIPMGRMLREVEVDVENDQVWVPEPLDGSIALIDGKTEELVKTFEGVADSPFDVQVGVQKNVVYIADFGADAVVKYDVRREKVLATIPVAASPQNLAYDAENGTLFVNGFSSSTITVIDTLTDTVINSYSPGAGTLSVEVDPFSSAVYVTNRVGATVAVLDGATGDLVAETAVDPLPNTVAVDNLSGDVWVTTKGLDTIHKLDVDTSDEELLERLVVGLEGYDADLDVHKAVKDLERALAAGDDARLFERYITRAEQSLLDTEADSAAAVVSSLLD